MGDNTGRRSRRGRVGCPSGCAGCGFVLIVGIILALIGGAAGAAISARIPGTHSNVTLSGSIGKKALTLVTLPPYTRKTFGRNNNFINSSNSLTIGPAQGRQEFVIGKQAGAPRAGIEIIWKTK